MYRFGEKSFEYLVKLSWGDGKRLEIRINRRKMEIRKKEKDTNVKMAGC